MKLSVADCRLIARALRHATLHTTPQRSREAVKDWARIFEDLANEGTAHQWVYAIDVALNENEAQLTKIKAWQAQHRLTESGS